MFVKDKTKVACRISGIKRIVIYFSKLLFETNDEKFSLGRVKTSRRKSVSEQSGGGRYLSQSCKGGMRTKVEYHLHKGGGLEKVRR